MIELSGKPEIAIEFTGTCSDWVITGNQIQTTQAVVDKGGVDLGTLCSNFIISGNMITSEYTALYGQDSLTGHIISNNIMEVTDTVLTVIYCVWLGACSNISVTGNNFINPSKTFSVFTPFGSSNVSIQFNVGDGAFNIIFLVNSINANNIVYP